MIILVFGAGPLGSIFTAQLMQGGHDVTLLARNKRLADLQEYGLVVHNTETNDWFREPVKTTDTLGDTLYDLILVIMRKNSALKILPLLAKNPTPNVLFLMNNAAGPDALVNILGKERVLTGFPMAAGYLDGYTIQALIGSPEEPSSIPIGEVDGTITPRLKEIAAALETMPNFTVDMRDDMDTWSKYHVALLMPGLAPALYACATDRLRFVRTRDAQVLAVRAMKESFRVLKSKGLPPTPEKLGMFLWLPEPIGVALLRKALLRPTMETAMVRHAEAARDEMKHLADEFIAIAHTTDVPTPAINRLYPYFHKGTHPLPEGSRAIPMKWGAIGAVVAGVASLIAGLVVLFTRKSCKEKSE